jgi:predicted RND superfamily exporter protein
LTDSKKPPFFARKTRIFGASNALLILMAACFLLPFALRGARNAMDNMQNDVQNWLPSDYPETEDLHWFGKHFLGEQFVLVTWDGCTEADPSFQMLIEKLRNEILFANTDELPPIDAKLSLQEQAVVQRARAYRAELIRARELADELGLYLLDDFNQNFAGLNERWLKGNDNLSYYITPDGSLYQSLVGDDLVAKAKTGFRRSVLKDNSVEAKFIDQFGDSFVAEGETNDFYDDPRKLTSRYFTSIRSGPDVIEEMAGKDGVLKPRGKNLSEADRAKVAELIALNRLTGTLFAPANPTGFTWNEKALRGFISKEKIAEFPENWVVKLSDFRSKVVAEQYAGDESLLIAATPSERAALWYQWFDEIEVTPPARQTCIIVTLSDLGEANLKRILGRGIQTDPRGTLVALAAESGVIPPPRPSMAPWAQEVKLAGKVLRLGGPPVDTAAIDEEGQVTLGRLVGISLLLGVVLSYLTFRSMKVTFMVFFVGGTSAIMSMAIVGYSGGIVDSILLTMPTLVYVLGISGAVHIVNYYRDAVYEHGEDGASERALSDGWWPCTIASFTTSLGLFSLYISNLTPIKNFGLYSGLGVLVTLVLLFTYLPAALKLWIPEFKKSKDSPNTQIANPNDSWLTRFWVAIGNWVMGHYKVVLGIGFLLLSYSVWGLTRVETSVQMLKLFDDEAKIIRDYEWLEKNFGKLTPMEMVVQVKPQAILPSREQRLATPPENVAERNLQKYQLTMLERLELVRHIQKAVEEVFGDAGQQVIGQGMSATTFAPELPRAGARTTRSTTNSLLEQNLKRLQDEDYLAYEASTGNELWRISLRLGALNDVNYGGFIDSLKKVVQPIKQAYALRNYLLHKFETDRGAGPDAYNQENVFFDQNKVLILGANPTSSIIPDATGDADQEVAAVDHVTLFARVVNDLLLVKGLNNHPRHPNQLWWLDPNDERTAKMLTDKSDEDLQKKFAGYEYVICLRDHAAFDKLKYAKFSKNFIDLTGFEKNGVAAVLGGEQTVSHATSNFDMVYTGIVPIVYKAQTELLSSLINSIGLAFVMIAVVMILLLRNGRLAWNNCTNFRGGMVSMIPNVFPVILVFGLMGHLGIALDIGSMMTASVAMGVAVDDTIHFLTWFRKGLNAGLDRKGALRLSYERCAAAMTQTTLIGGLGLSIFALSSFTPTQRFGVLMLTLLAAALIGDLIFLPAILSSPLGKYFSSNKTVKKNSRSESLAVEGIGETPSGENAEGSNVGGPHGHLKSDSELDRILRHDKGHKL